MLEDVSGYVCFRTNVRKMILEHVFQIMSGTLSKEMSDKCKMTSDEHIRTDARTHVRLLDDVTMEVGMMHKKCRANLEKYVRLCQHKYPNKRQIDVEATMFALPGLFREVCDVFSACISGVTKNQTGFVPRRE